MKGRRPKRVENIPPWKDYEADIASLLKEKASPNAEVRTNVLIPGHWSKVDRQIDILVKGDFAGVKQGATMAVDCKAWSTKIDVADVEAFLGLIDDVRATMGMMITTIGYSDAATNRAQGGRGIDLSIVKYEDLPSWEPPLFFCPVCAQSRDPEEMPGAGWIEETFEVTLDGDRYRFGVGHCEMCATMSIECSNCGGITPFLDSGWDEWKECEGGCGLDFNVSAEETDRKGISLGTPVIERIRVRLAEE